MTIQLTHARPFTSNDGASYQINGKIATSKGGGKEDLRPFEQVDSLLVARLLTTKTFYTPTRSFETFLKDKHFVRVLIETRAITKKTPFQNHFQKHIPQILL